MGQNHLDADIKSAGRTTEQSGQVLDNQRVEIRDKFVSDALAPTADSLGQRLLTVTKEAVNQVPQAFVNSLDAKNILPNVAIGFGLGAISKTVLPETGPVGKAAGAALGAWFVGKPVVESYYMAATARTNADMAKASHHLAETIGGAPVAIAEGAVGAKLGAMAAGKVLGTAAADSFMLWKGKQWGTRDVVAGKDVASKWEITSRDNAYGGKPFDLDVHLQTERGHGPNYFLFQANPKNTGIRDIKGLSGKF